MEKVDTGSALIHRYDGALAPVRCQRRVALNSWFTRDSRHYWP